MSFIGGLGQGIGDSFSRAFMQARGMSADRKRDAQMMAFRDRAFAEQVSAREAADARAEKSDAATAAHRGQMLAGQREAASAAAQDRAARMKLAETEAQRMQSESSERLLREQRQQKRQEEIWARGERQWDANQTRLDKQDEDRRDALAKSDLASDLKSWSDYTTQERVRFEQLGGKLDVAMNTVDKTIMNLALPSILNTVSKQSSFIGQLATAVGQGAVSESAADSIVTRMGKWEDKFGDDFRKKVLGIIEKGREGTEGVIDTYNTASSRTGRLFRELSLSMARKEPTEELEALANELNESIGKTEAAANSALEFSRGFVSRAMRQDDDAPTVGPPTQLPTLTQKPTAEDVPKALSQAMLKEMSKKSREAFAHAWDLALREGGTETLHARVVEMYNREEASGEGWLALDDDDQFLLLPTAKDLGVPKPHLHEYYRKKFSDSGSAQAEYDLLRDRGNLVGKVTKGSLKKAMGERDVERSLPGRLFKATRGVPPVGKINRVQEVLGSWRPSAATFRETIMGNMLPITYPITAARRAFRAWENPGEEIPFIPEDALWWKNDK